MTGFITFLARRRVALGFVTAAAAAVLAQPTWASLRNGLLVAMLGEALRVWAAGHLEKGREVTRSGPYRWMRHPLYAGSSILALGVVIASRSVVLAVVAAIYLSVTITAAVRREEAHLRRAFGDEYDRYAGSASVKEPRQAAPVDTEEARQAVPVDAEEAHQAVPVDAAKESRRFSLARAVRNREYRAVIGLLVGFAFLALKIVVSPN